MVDWRFKISKHFNVQVCQTLVYPLNLLLFPSFEFWHFKWSNHNYSRFFYSYYFIRPQKKKSARSLSPKSPLTSPVTRKLIWIFPLSPQIAQQQSKLPIRRNSSLAVFQDGRKRISRSRNKLRLMARSAHVFCCDFCDEFTTF